MPLTRTLKTLALVALLAPPPSPAQVDGVTCTSTRGDCEVTSFYDDGATTETEINVSPMEGVDAFVTTLDFAGRRDLAVPWSRPSSPSAECSQQVVCENGAVIDCYREGPCSSGENGFAVYCGMFLPVRRPWLPNASFEATIRTCRGLADPWPDLPPPHPIPPPPPPPPPQPRPGPKKPGPEGPPAGVCTAQQVINANQTPRDFRQVIHMKTTKPRPGSRLAGNFDSEIVVRHDAPEATHVEAAVFTDAGPERHETLHLGTTLYWKTPNGQWMAMDPSRMTGSQPVAPSLHDRYGPRGFVRAIRPGNFEYVGTGACQGVLDGESCFAFYFVDGGFDHNAYVSAQSCLLRSVIGENEEGPLSIVIHYEEQVVERPRPGGR